MRCRVAMAILGTLVAGGCGSGHADRPHRSVQGTTRSVARTAYQAREQSPRQARRGLLAHLAHPLLRRGEACPVTRPNFRDHPPPAYFRGLGLGDARGVYGRGKLWAFLPAGRINVYRDPHHGWFREKVGWLVGVPGLLHIAARRIDHRVVTLGHGDIAPPAPTAAPRIEPTNVLLPTTGCWQVAGGVGTAVLTWIFNARA
jgi:hypothetical protein